jgi:hypothetical protein
MAGNTPIATSTANSRRNADKISILASMPAPGQQQVELPLLGDRLHHAEPMWPARRRAPRWRRCPRILDRRWGCPAATDDSGSGVSFSSSSFPISMTASSPPLPSSPLICSSCRVELMWGQMGFAGSSSTAR